MRAAAEQAGGLAQRKVLLHGDGAGVRAQSSCSGGAVRGARGLVRAVAARLGLKRGGGMPE